MAEDTIHINSVVSQRDYRPFVQLKWGELRCQLTPEEARQHAYSILEAANAAEMDTGLCLFLKEKVNLSDEVDIAHILKDFREYRERKFVAQDGSHKTKL